MNKCYKKSICNGSDEMSSSRITSSTSREIQRIDFVETLYRTLNQQTKKVLAEKGIWMQRASQYVDDGMDKSECIELLIIDGLSKEAATGYVEAAFDNVVEEDIDGDTYSFQFEDVYGKIWTSNDIGKVVVASSEDTAWEKAEAFLFSENGEYEPERLISVHKEG